MIFPSPWHLFFCHVHLQVYMYVVNNKYKLSTFHMAMVTSIIPYSGKFSRGPIFAEGQTSSISRSNFREWPFQNCSAHNTWLTPPLTACTRRLVLPGSYATFQQNELLSIKAHRCSHSILSTMFSYLKSGENFS